MPRGRNQGSLHQGIRLLLFLQYSGRRVVGLFLFRTGRITGASGQSAAQHYIKSWDPTSD